MARRLPARHEDHGHVVLERRGLAIGILIGALTVGSATPWLIRGLTTLPWRQTLLAASGLALLGAGGRGGARPRGPASLPSARFDPRMALPCSAERGPRLACLGYFAATCGSSTRVGLDRPRSCSTSAWAAGATAQRALPQHGDVRRDRDRRARLLARRRRLGPLGPSPRRSWPWPRAASARPRSAHVRRSAGGHARAGAGVGRDGRRRLGAVLDGDHRAVATRLRRHGADHADVRGVRADEHLDLAAAADSSPPSAGAGRSRRWPSVPRWGRGDGAAAPRRTPSGSPAAGAERETRRWTSV